MNHVLVTGATGFLGKRLVRSLLQDGHRVRCLVRATSNVAGLQQFVGDTTHLEIMHGDLTEMVTVQQALEGIDVLYHAAAAMTGSFETIQRHTVEPTRTVLQAAVACKTPRVVHISSLGVYDTSSLPRGSTLDERCPLEQYPQRRDNYTRGKLLQEELVWQAHQEHNLPVVVTRPGVIIGPGRGALSNRLGLKLGSLQLCLGNRTLPYTYVDNAADAIRLAGLEKDIAGQAFNIVDADLPTCHDLLAAYQQHGRKVKALRLGEWAIKPLTWTGRISRHTAESMWKPLAYSHTKAQAALHWQPLVPMKEALRRSIVDSL
ncbi:MAG: SDR family NAD(P)-dependent oxidoreductase [Gemmatales bacterium]